MLKHITLKDLVEFFLIAVGIMALMLVASILESAPLGIAFWLAVVLATILWIAWFVIVTIQRDKEARRAKVKIRVDGEWVDIDSTEGAAMFHYMHNNNYPSQQIFDQLDLSNKE